MKRAVFGAGGSCHEVRSITGDFSMPAFVDEKYWKPNHDNIFSISQFDPAKFSLLIAVGNSKDKYDIHMRLPVETVFWSFVHPSAQIQDNRFTKIGVGSFISSNCIIVCNSKIGVHSFLNLATTIGHDTDLGDYFTSAPGVNISGDCRIGKRVYFGTNSCCKQKITICDDVTIGMGAAVIKDITESGTYVGCPAKRIK
jgi:sugar O-acyltransferase (sialic acid O-acetyltransferase NeuD family)